MFLSAANANDSTMFEAVLDDLPPIRSERCSERFDALAMLVYSVICFNSLQRPPW